MNTLVAGQCYTVKDGSLKGITGIAVEQSGCEGKTVHVLQSPDFKCWEISFCGALHKLRKATPKEEVRFWRAITL
jgi:hypothetical protein